MLSAYRLAAFDFKRVLDTHIFPLEQGKALQNYERGIILLKDIAPVSIELTLHTTTKQ